MTTPDPTWDHPTLTREQFMVRKAQLAAKECKTASGMDELSDGIMHLEGNCDCVEEFFYYSFADRQFRGAAIVKATGYFTGLQKTHDLNINPGGQVVGQPFPDGAKLDEKYVGTLLSKRRLREAMNSIGVELQRRGA